jgi:hypothetical protein
MVRTEANAIRLNCSEEARTSRLHISIVWTTPAL